MACLDEYITYRDQLIADIQSQKPSYKLNSDCGHNAMVLSAMLNTNTNINMLCGKMSPFRESLYKRLKQDLMDNDHFDENKASYISDKVKNEMISSYKEFFSKPDSHFNLFVINYEDNQIHDFIDASTFDMAIKADKLNIYKFSDEFYGKQFLLHATMGDETIVRIENDNEKHSALVFVMPETKLIKNLNKTYSILKRATLKIQEKELD